MGFDLSVVESSPLFVRLSGHFRRSVGRACGFDPVERRGTIYEAIGNAVEQNCAGKELA